MTVANSGDRPIQVGSHYHFFETNPALKFDRSKARGMRLDIAAGTAVRFEPGQTREVRLVEMAGTRTVYGFWLGGRSVQRGSLRWNNPDRFDGCDLSRTKAARHPWPMPT